MISTRMVTDDGQIIEVFGQNVCWNYSLHFPALVMSLEQFIEVLRAERIKRGKTK